VILLIAVSFFGFGFQILLAWGLRKETASRGSLAVYTQIVFAYILERIVFHETPSLLSVIGTGIILGSGLFVALTKEKDISDRRQQPHDEENAAEYHELAMEESEGIRGMEEENTTVVPQEVADRLIPAKRLSSETLLSSKTADSSVSVN